MMKNMNTLKICLLLSVGFSCSVAFAAHNKSKESVLFVETAQSAILTSQTLTLNDVSQNTLWFMDKPMRKFGLVATQKFASDWPQNFKKVPPNAAVTNVTLEGKKTSTVNTKVLEISNPVYDVGKQALTYTVHFIDQTKAPASPQEYKDVSLFIDNSNCDMECGDIGFGAAI